VRGGSQVIPRPAGTRIGGPPPWSDLDVGALDLSLDNVERVLAASGPPVPSPLEGTGVRASAVLAPLYELDGETFVVLTRRAQHLRAHRGEVSFPGGGVEPGESAAGAAVREAREEIALDPTLVRLIGELDHLQTYSSQSYITPFVGALGGRPSLEPSPAEVEKILHVALRELLLPEVYREEHWGLRPLDRPLYFFELYGDTVWGATALMLRNLLALVTGVAHRSSGARST
jgi:8-oxo-dGTP pyrophosphatase MutT (NUDIX family)